MGSDGDNNNKGKELSKVSLDADKVKDLAKSKLSIERSKLKTEEAVWTQQPTEFDRFPPHEKPFSIEPFPHERSRIPFKMTDEDRLRRKTWVQSQELTEREPVRVPELERMIYNPIRRLYRLPTDRVFNALAPLIGEKRVPIARYVVPKVFMAYLAGCVFYYNVKYNKPVCFRFKLPFLKTTFNK
jgi:hypothetical protein